MFIDTSTLSNVEVNANIDMINLHKRDICRIMQGYVFQFLYITKIY